MPKTMTFQTFINYQQQQWLELIEVTGDNEAGSQPADGIPAAKEGDLTTRTSATVGTLTMDPGHGIITGDRISIFWDGGSRYNVLVGTVSGDSVPFTVGSGDDLPTNNTPITAAVGTVESVTFTGSAAVCALAYWTPTAGDGDGIVEFLQSDNTLVAAFTVTVDSPASGWNGQSATPFGANVGKVRFTHGQTSARTMGTTVLYD